MNKIERKSNTVHVVTLYVNLNASDHMELFLMRIDKRVTN